ncbi:calcitonin/calcitonin-related polypeptide, alpha isoform X2 [Poecilia formosa]|uniref:calcitonin/calcitonin-related polypeptide, alpha isoform X2 n=2 Tax=Poecilia TaxID=8080 RepID=UPI0007B8DC74|nr:PREDICTED: calcitonin-1-like isoform X2 [Poecilia formosa]
MGDVYKTVHCEKAQQIHKSARRLRLQTIYNHKGIMSMLKLRTLLLGYALFFCQMSSNAAPSSKESMSDGVTLLNKDAETLLRAIKEFVQITSDEPAKQPADGESWNRPVSKRCTGLSTCVLGRLSQDIHKLQTYPPTDVGAGTPGKRRSLPEFYDNYISTYN